MNITKEDIAHAIISRLIDNYEDKGEFFEEFEEIGLLLAKAIAKSEFFERFEGLSLDNGIIEEDYFSEV